MKYEPMKDDERSLKLDLIWVIVFLTSFAA